MHISRLCAKGLILLLLSIVTLDRAFSCMTVLLNANKDFYKYLLEKVYILPQRAPMLKKENYRWQMTGSLW